LASSIAEQKRGGARQSSVDNQERVLWVRVILLKFLRSLPGMAEDRDRYKDYAAECLRLAQQTTDTAQRACLLEMADAWQRLAEQAAKRGSPE
jgi:hypothetical protein